MDIFHDMKKYRTGRSPEGNDLFNVPLKADEDGMIGRECPNEDCQPKYFKSFTLFTECDQKDRIFLQEQFLKRHVLTHNLGLIDKKYIEKAHAYEKQGAELDIKPVDVSRALEIVVGIVTAASQCLEKPG